MANELRAYYNGSATLYAIIRRQTDAYVWNGSAFEAWVNGNIATYDIPLTSQGGDLYSANFPSAITTSGVFYVDYYIQAGGSPATTDYRLPSGDSINWTGSSVVTSGSSSTGTMTLTAARVILRAAARNAGDSTVHSDTDVDNAILSIGNDFVNRTRCVHEFCSVSLVDGTATLADLGNTATGIRPDRIRRMYILGHGPLSIVDMAAIEEMIETNGESEGVPLYIAFTGAEAATLYPTPDDDYTLKTQWYPPFTSFTAGTGSPDGVTLNIPDDLIRPVLEHGAVWKLQQTVPEHQGFVWQLKQSYEEHVARSMGACSLGPRAIYTRRASYAPPRIRIADLQ